MMQAGLPLVIVQPGAVYGPGDHSLLGNTLRDYLRRRLPLVPQGAAFCWAHIADVARGHILAMERGTPGETYIIAGECATLQTTPELAQSITGIPVPRLKAPPGLLKANAALMGVIEKVVPLPPTYASETLRVSAGVTYLGDNSKARRDLGYNPRALADGLRETLTYEMGKLGITPPRDVELQQQV